MCILAGPPQAKKSARTLARRRRKIPSSTSSFSRHQRLPSFLFLFPSSTSPLFFFLCGCWHHKQESRLSYEYSSSERLARAGRHPPSTRPLLCRCVVAPPRILPLQNVGAPSPLTSVHVSCLCPRGKSRHPLRGPLCWPLIRGTFPVLRGVSRRVRSGAERSGSFAV